MDPAASTSPVPTPLPEARAYCPTTTFGKTHREGALLVDVREADEVAALAFDAPDVVHLPLSSFERRFAELPRDRELVLACAVGVRSLKATYYLMYQGYANVANLSGGIQRWAAKGFPVRGSLEPTFAAGGCCGGSVAAEPSAAVQGCGCDDGACGCEGGGCDC